MEYKQSNNFYFVRIDRGEEVLAKLKEVCEKENITLGKIEGLGATDKLTIGLFDIQEKFYHKTTLTGPMEITSFIGNISTSNRKTYLHCHINVCNKKMQIFGGHLNECFISATGEFVITKAEGTVERELDKEIGLNLFKFID